MTINWDELRKKHNIPRTFSSDIDLAIKEKASKEDKKETQKAAKKETTPVIKKEGTPTAKGVPFRGLSSGMKEQYSAWGKEFEKPVTTPWSDLLYKAAGRGGGYFIKAVNGLLDFTNYGTSKLFGEKNGIYGAYPGLKKARDYTGEQATGAIKAYQDLPKTIAQQATGDIVSSGVRMAPDLVLAAGTGGVSAAAEGEAALNAARLGYNVANAGRKGALLAPLAKTSKLPGAVEAALNWIKEPVNIERTSLYFGQQYGQAKEEGASESDAIKSALLYAFPSAIIERAGGPDPLIKKILAKQAMTGGKAAIKDILRSSFEEGIEELAQYPFQGLADSVYKDVPLYSTTKEALVNPKDMAYQAGIGAAAGGIFAGGIQGINALNTKGKTIQGEAEKLPVNLPLQEQPEENFTAAEQDGTTFSVGDAVQTSTGDIGVIVNVRKIGETPIFDIKHPDGEVLGNVGKLTKIDTVAEPEQAPPAAPIRQESIQEPDTVPVQQERPITPDVNISVPKTTAEQTVIAPTAEPSVKQAEEVEQPVKNDLSFGRNGKNAYKHWAGNEWVNLDLNDVNNPRVQAYNRFSRKWYEAGRVGLPEIRVPQNEDDTEFPAFLQQAFYLAGKNDAEAIAKKNKKPDNEAVKQPEEQNMQEVITEYQNSTDEGLVEFAKAVLDSPYSAALDNQKYVLGPVEQKQADDINRVSGVDVFGFRRVIRGKDIRHINNGHGPDGDTDQSMADLNDLGRIQYVLDNYDNLVLLNDTSSEFRNKDNKPAKLIQYGKKINGTYYVVEAVPDTRAKTVNVISVYKNNAVQQAPDVAPPGRHVRNVLAATASDTTIAQNADGVNNSIPGKAQNNANKSDTEPEQIKEKAQKEEGGIEDGDKAEQVRDNGGKPLEGIQAEDVRGNEEERNLGSEPGGSTGTDGGGTDRTGRSGISGRRGLGDSEGEIHLPADGRGRAEPVTEEKPEKEPALPEVVEEQISQTSTPEPKGSNFVITGPLELGGEKQRFKDNLAAIKLVKQLQAEDRFATAEEQKVLAKYVGWGGLSHAFANNKPGWEGEYIQLKEALSAEEYIAARGSTLNAHYTSIDVIKSMYEGLKSLGFKGGRMLEPAGGVGHFIGAMPAAMSKTVNSWTLVELDNITGLIAKYLYPNANVKIQGFEKANIPDNFIDVAISNVPFGDYAIVDEKYPKTVTKAIHNYFFAKALDKVRPGGIVMFITSRYTMDSKNSAVREYIAKQADFLGAIRLPNTAFKGNANTEVITDIIVLQKRAEGQKAKGQSFVNTDYLELPGGNYEVINEYFLNHPEMALGTPKIDRGMYSGRTLTYDPIPGELSEQIKEAFSKMKGKMTYPAKTAKEVETAVADYTFPAPDTVKNNAFAVANDGNIYVLNLQCKCNRDKE